LSGYNFENTKAVNFAAKAVTDLLEFKNDSWVGKDDKELAVVIKDFCENPDHAFLLKKQRNSGPELGNSGKSLPSKPTVSHEERVKQAYGV
jgi:hypothetical protein